MIEADEEALWKAVVTAGPDNDGLIRVVPLGHELGLATKRIEYLCRKWCVLDKCILFASYAIKLPEWKSVSQV